jgi:hypothetical protein
VSPADGIRKLGFGAVRTSADRSTTFITCFLCMIMVLACLEDFSLRAAGKWQPLATLALILGGAAVGFGSQALQEPTRSWSIFKHSTCAIIPHTPADPGLERHLPRAAGNRFWLGAMPQVRPPVADR